VDEFYAEFGNERLIPPLTAGNFTLSGVRNSGPLRRSKPRIYRFALERQHTEDTFMSSTQWLLSNKTVESFHAKSEFSARERSLRSETTRPQAFQVLGHQVLRSVDDAQILGPAALYCGLSVSAPAFTDEVERLYHHAFTTG
jgi:hypothetical protein